MKIRIIGLFMLLTTGIVYCESASNHALNGEAEEQYTGSQRPRYVRTGRGLKALSSCGYPPELTHPESLKGKKVLDLATGKGDLVEDLRAAPYNVDIVGLDIYLSEAQKKKPYFIQADATHTGLANESFDYIFSSFGVFYYGEAEGIPNDGLELKEYAREAKRILKPGGKIAIVPAPLMPDKFKKTIERVGGLKVILHPEATCGWGWLEIEKIPFQGDRAKACEEYGKDVGQAVALALAKKNDSDLQSSFLVIALVAQRCTEACFSPEKEKRVLETCEKLSRGEIDLSDVKL